MTKWILAAIMTVGAFATAGNSRAPAPSPQPDTVATGTCTYTCSSNGVTYLNRTRCLAACSGTCEVEVC